MDCLIVKEKFLTTFKEFVLKQGNWNQAMNCNEMWYEKEEAWWWNIDVRKPGGGIQKFKMP